MPFALQITSVVDTAKANRRAKTPHQRRKGHQGAEDQESATTASLMKRKTFELKTQNPTLRALQKSGLRHDAKEELV